MNVNKCPDEQDLHACYEEQEKVRNEGLQQCVIKLIPESSDSQDEPVVIEDDQQTEICEDIIDD